MVMSLSVVATSTASSSVMDFNNVASFQRLLQASYMARSVVVRLSRDASTISCLPRLVTSGRSADASRRYFTVFSCPHERVWLPVLDLFYHSGVLLAARVFRPSPSIPAPQGT